MSMKTMISFRVTRELRDDFYKKARQYGGVSDVHRRLLQAFVDDRMIIKPDPNQPTLESTDAD